jgi:signal transduction histidine kinase/CheY-like chemotaxis protein/PAS domain-containing protein
MHAKDGEDRQAQRYHDELLGSQSQLAIHSLPELKNKSSREDLSAVNLLDALDLDSRPSFAIEIAHPPPQHIALNILYCNPVLAADEDLLAKIKEEDQPSIIFADLHTGFRNWLFGPTSEKGSYVFEGYIWSATTLDHYRVVSGIQTPETQSPWAGPQGTPHLNRVVDPREHKQPQNLPQIRRAFTLPADTSIDTGHARNDSRPKSSKHGPFDYTRDMPLAKPSAHLQYFRNVDWPSTVLGPMNTWSPQLRCMANMTLNNSLPCVLLWGEDAVMIYNEAYIEIIGVLHPCMGQSARVAASEYWGLFQPLIDHINATGETLTESDLPLFIDRHGFLEETYYSFQLIPILDGDGFVAGHFQPFVETTTNNVQERRVRSLVEIGSQTAKARDLETYWELVLDTLSMNEKDAPFAVIYAIEYETGHDLSSTSSPGSLSDIEIIKLKGSIAVSAGHRIAPAAINLKQDSSIFTPYLLKAAKSRRPTVLHFEELDLPESFLEGIDWQGYGDPCRSVIICPIQPTTSEQIQGFLILGVNPRRPFDIEYQQYIHVMSRLLATSLASVVLFEEEMRQKEDAIGQAARIQEQLMAELQMKEQKFQRFCARSDVAIFITDIEGNYTYRNESWFDIFEIAKDFDDVMSAWSSLVFPEDIAFCENLFTSLVVDKSPICFELKTKMPWHPPDADGRTDGEVYYRWILCSAYPETNAQGEMFEIVGNVTDISKQKWAEDVQKRRSDSAVQSKTHLEHFIDTTSHEMRNPLSAIMQCADGILSSCNGDQGELPSPITYGNILEQVVDSAQTIAQCAQHMKRIVDDILTISKIDSGLLVITPVDAQPESVAYHAVKMFEPEAKAAGVDLTFHVEQAYRDMAIDWASLDPTRLLQILINLITNAVKFTRLESTRTVTVSISASSIEPAGADGIRFVRPTLVSPDRSLQDDWKKGSTIYLQFSVSDTGRGLSEDEKRTLFARFSQASPRTHIHYGGSGLGLFISRRLTELQGGSIGLTSESKKGSTFSFYIKARRTSPVQSHRKNSMPSVFSENIKSPPQIHEGTQTTSTTHLRPAALTRQESVTQHPDVPAEAMGVEPPDTAFEELQRTNSIPETLHILVVEDNLVNQKVLAKQLRNLGCVVSVANHGVEALEFLQKTKFWKDDVASSPHSAGTSSLAQDLPLDLSLILMDWEMPIMNGLTCVSKIRELEREGRLVARIPVIGVTANVRQQQIEEAMSKGMDDVVGKPFRVKELLGRMKGVVAGTMGWQHGRNGEG